MKDARQNMIVGLFALCGVGILAVLIFVFGGGRGLFSHTYNVNVVFPKGVIGVQSGQGVTLNGKRIGDTLAVDFLRDESGAYRPELGVNVVLAIDGQLDLPAASKVIVVSSIMGFGRPAVQFVVLDSAKPQKLPKDGSAKIFGEMMPVLDQLLPKEMQTTLGHATEDIGALAAALKPVAENIARLLESRNIQQVDLQQATANLDTVVQRFDATLKNINLVLGDSRNQENLGAILANARVLTENGADAMKNFREISTQGKVVIGNVNVLAQRLTATADDLSTVLKRMDQSLYQINEGKGTAGLFLRDNRLYEEMVLTTRRMTTALDDLREVLDLAKKGKLRLF